MITRLTVLLAAAETSDKKDLYPKLSELIIGAPIAPGRPRRTAFPARIVGHGQSTLTSFCRLRRLGGSGSPLALTRRPQLVNETSPT